MTPIEIPFTPTSEIPFTPKIDDTITKMMDHAGDENSTHNILGASNCTQAKVSQLRELFEQRTNEEKVSADKLRPQRAPSAEARLCVRSLPLHERNASWLRTTSATIRRDRYKHLQEHRQTREALVQQLKASGVANFLSPFKSPESSKSSPLQDEVSPATGLALEQIKSNRDISRVQNDLLKIVRCLMGPADCGGLQLGTGGDGSTGLLEMVKSPQPTAKQAAVEPLSAEKVDCTGFEDCHEDDDADTGADSQESEVAPTMDSQNTSAPQLEEEAECEEPEKVSLEESPRNARPETTVGSSFSRQEVSESQEPEHSQVHSHILDASSLRLPELMSVDPEQAEEPEGQEDALAETSCIEADTSPSSSSQSSGDAAECSDLDAEEQELAACPFGGHIPHPGQESLPRHMTVLHALEQQELFQEVLVTVPELPSAERWVQFEYAGQPIQIQVPEGYETGQQMPVALLRKRPPLERSKELMNVRGHNPHHFVDRSCIMERLKHCPRANGRDTKLSDDEMRGRHNLYRHLRGREMQPLLADMPEELDDDVSDSEAENPAASEGADVAECLVEADS